MHNFDECYRLLSQFCTKSFNDKVNSYSADMDWLGAVYCEYGNILSYFGKFTKAIEIYNQAVDRLGYIEALVEKGKVLYETKKYREAIKSFDIFINMFNDDVVVDKNTKKRLKVHNLIGMYYKANCLKELEDYKASIDLYNILIKLDDHNPLFVFMKGMIFYLLADMGGNKEEAQVYINKAKDMLDGLEMQNQDKLIYFMLDSNKMTILRLTTKLLLHKAVDRNQSHKQSRFINILVKMVNRIQIINEEEIYHIHEEEKAFYNNYKYGDQKTKVDQLINSNSDLQDYIDGFMGFYTSTISIAHKIQQDKVPALSKSDRFASNTKTYALLGPDFIKILPFLSEDIFSINILQKSSLLTKTIPEDKLQKKIDQLLNYSENLIDSNFTVHSILYTILLDNVKYKKILRYGRDDVGYIKDWFAYYQKIINEFNENNFQEYENPYMEKHSSMYMLGIKDFQDI